MVIIPLISSSEQELLIKLFLAFFIGLIIGYERDRGGKPAGMRTQMLICVGSALLAGISIHLGDSYVASTGIRPDPARLMAQIVTGIGFVCAGVILKSSNRISGVTTAATLWLTAAIGIAIGSGFFASAILATVFILFLEPLAALKSYLGLKLNVYTLQMAKKHAIDIEQYMQENLIKYHMDDTQEIHMQFTIFTTPKKISNLQSYLNSRKISFDINETED